jgi:hypothetical protein
MKQQVHFQMHSHGKEGSPTTKCRLTTGILPVNLNYRHPKGDPDPGVGSRPARRS